MKSIKLKQHRRAKRHDKQEWTRQVRKEVEETKAEKIPTSDGNR